MLNSSAASTSLCLGGSRECVRVLSGCRCRTRSRRAAVLLAARAQGVPRTVYAPPHEERRAWCMCDRLHFITQRGDDTLTTPRRARARCRGSCCCEQRADRYYRFTLEGETVPPPLEPPPINGLCNSTRLCRPRLRP